MARRELRMEELVEVLYQWHQGRNISQIKRSLGLDRKTIRKYIELAQGCGLSRGREIQPDLYYMRLAGAIQRRLRTPLVVSASFKRTLLYQHLIGKLLKRRYMTPKQVFRILRREHGYPLSYSSFKRYMNIKYPKKPRGCLRIEVAAGEEAQVDFGTCGRMVDPRAGIPRKAYIFVMVLSYSRHFYVEFVFDQGQRTWVQCHIHAFEFFGGVPERVVLDNLKSGVLKPHTYDPVFNRAYAECAKHYGFIIDPAKVRKGEHKGKVERRIPVVRQQFLTLYDLQNIREANERVSEWCVHGYGSEAHGTTKRKPYEVFKAEEQARLQGLPEERFDIPVWKEAKVHADHHLVFQRSYYSVPTRYIGKKVWVRGGLERVLIFYEGALIKSHGRASRPGSWVTDERDYPPEQSKYLLKPSSYYRQQASGYGKYVRQVVVLIMKERAYRNLRKVQALFRLGDIYGNEALNLTCQRCLYYYDYRMDTIRRILKKGLYQLPLDEEVSTQPQQSNSFVRPVTYFIHTEEVQS
jgi:transposase